MQLVRIILLTSLVALAAAGCAGDQLIAPGTITAESTAAASGAGAAYADVATGAAKPDGVPSPFADQPAAATGGREVIEKPSREDVMLTGTLPEMSWGRADAPVTFVKYASLTCPHCRKFHAEVFPELKRTYIDTGKVRFVLREFPIGKTSGTATIALRCAKPERYLELYGKFLSQQASWVSQEVRLDPIFSIARQVGMTRAEFDACLKNQGMIDGLKWVKDRGRKLGVIGTPNFFVQERLIKSTLGWAELKALIDASLAATGPATAAAPATVAPGR